MWSGWCGGAGGLGGECRSGWGGWARVVVVVVDAVQPGGERIPPDRGGWMGEAGLDPVSATS